MSRRSRRRLGSSLGVFIVTLALAIPAAGIARPPFPQFWPVVRSSSGWTLPIAPGVSYSRFRVVTADGPLSIHHLVLDLNNPGVRLDVALAHNQLISSNETVSSMVRRSGAIAGINADYFDIRESGMPLNIMVQGGRLLRSPSGRVALALLRAGGFWIGHYRWHGSAVNLATRESHWLAGFNTGFVRDGIVAISNVRGYGAPVPEPGVKQTVIELVPAADMAAGAVPYVSSNVQPSEDTEGRYVVRAVWPQQAFYAPFPKDEVLLVGHGRAADWLLGAMPVGAPVQVNLTTAPDWHLARAIIGGGPFLVANGRIADDPHSPAPGERHRRSPVAAIGISQDSRRVLLAEIDGRQPRVSIGLTQPQLASYMQWLGAFQAMAFDSGGSATVVGRVPWRPVPSVLNSPSDGHERPVGNALLVFSPRPEVAVSSQVRPPR